MSLSTRQPAHSTRVSTVSRDTSELERAFYGELIEQLIDARRCLSITQTALEHKLGVSDGLVGKWESFQRMPSSFMLMCWCVALGVTIKFTVTIPRS